MLMVVLLLALVADALHSRADAQREAQALTSEMEADAAELEVAEDALISEEKGAEAQAKARDEVADLHAKLSELQGLSKKAVVGAIERDLLELESALSSQLEHLSAGDLVAAEEVDEQQTDPAFAAFDERVEAAHDYYAAAAGRSSTISSWGLWLGALFAAVAICVLSWRQELSRRAAREALEHRLRERAAALEELAERHRRLEAMKYSFVAAVSHELRTPLTAIHGSLEMLEDDAAGLPPTAGHLVSVAARSTRRLSRLVDEILDLERLESGQFRFEPEPHDLHVLLLGVVELMAPLAERAGVDLVLDETHAEVVCDGDGVEQTLVNLVGNAIKFSTRGGSIHVEVARRSEEVEVSVRDEGRGIPPDQLGSVFDRFHQVDARADRALGGVGLGLTISRHVVEAHGGRIWVESDGRTGTVFRFTLPLSRPESRDVEAVPPSAGEPVQRV